MFIKVSSHDLKIPQVIILPFHLGDAEEAKKEDRLTGGNSGKSWLDSDRDYTYDEVSELWHNLPYMF